MPASPRAARRSWVWLLSIKSPSCWSVVVAAATDVAVLDGIGVGGGVGKEGLVEAGLEDRGDRPIARCANADPTAACGLEPPRSIGLLHPQDTETGSEALFRMRLCPHNRFASATVDGPICSAAASRRAGVQKAYRRCALGMCSGIVVCRRFTPERAWLAMRVPRWNTSMVASVARTSTTWRIMRDGTE